MADPNQLVQVASVDPAQTVAPTAPPVVSAAQPAPAPVQAAQTYPVAPAQPDIPITNAQDQPNLGAIYGDPTKPDWYSKNITTITTPGGAKFNVNKSVADNMLAFTTELEQAGVKINPQTSGGYNLRPVTGGGELSPHAYGIAIDVNPETNPYSKDPNGGVLTTTMPANISQIAAKYGLTWGGDWKSLKDPMHFQMNDTPGALEPYQVAQNGPGVTTPSTVPAGAQPPPDPYRIVGRAINQSENPFLGTNAADPNSQAVGNGQFQPATWLTNMQKWRPDLTAGKTQQQILAMRADPDLSEDMTTNYAKTNGAALANLGLPVDSGTLYMAHALGTNGAIAALRADPNTPLGSIIGWDTLAKNPSWGPNPTVQGFRTQMTGLTTQKMKDTDDVQSQLESIIGKPAPAPAAPTVPETQTAPTPDDDVQKQIDAIVGTAPAPPVETPSLLPPGADSGTTPGSTPGFGTSGALMRGLAPGATPHPWNLTLPSMPSVSLPIPSVSAKGPQTEGPDLGLAYGVPATMRAQTEKEAQASTSANAGIVQGLHDIADPIAEKLAWFFGQGSNTAAQDKQVSDAYKTQYGNDPTAQNSRSVASAAATVPLIATGNMALGAGIRAAAPIVGRVLPASVDAIEQGYKALTTQPGLRGWITNNVGIPAVQGAVGGAEAGAVSSRSSDDPFWSQVAQGAGYGAALNPLLMGGAKIISHAFDSGETEAPALSGRMMPAPPSTLSSKQPDPVYHYETADGSPNPPHWGEHSADVPQAGSGPPHPGPTPAEEANGAPGGMATGATATPGQPAGPPQLSGGFDDWLTTRAYAEQQKLAQTEAQRQANGKGDYGPGVHNTDYIGEQRDSFGGNTHLPEQEPPNPTVAEVQQTPDNIALYNVLKKDPTYGPAIDGIQAGRNDARVGEFDRLAGDPFERQFLENRRTNDRDQDTGKAFNGQYQSVPDTQSVVDLIDQRIAANPGRPNITNLLQGVKNNLIGADGKTLMTDPEMLYNVRQGIDDSLKTNVVENQKNLAAKDELGGVKDQLDSVIKDAVPDTTDPATGETFNPYDRITSRYAANSQRLNEMDTLQDYRGKVIDTNGQMQYAPFQRMMSQIVADRAAGGAENANSISLNNMQKLWNLRDDLARKASLESATPNAAMVKGYRDQLGAPSLGKKLLLGGAGVATNAGLGYLGAHFGGPLGAAAAEVPGMALDYYLANRLMPAAQTARAAKTMGDFANRLMPGDGPATNVPETLRIDPGKIGWQNQPDFASTMNRLRQIR